MKKFALIIILLVLLPITPATEIFNEWVEDAETFKAGSHYFTVQYIQANQKLNLKMDGTGGMMVLGECETRENIRYCFEELEYPNIRVKVESLEPDVSIERTFSKTSIYLHEETTVTVLLRNDGGKKATDIKYTDTYPSALMVIPNKNTATWEGSLNVGEENTFTYILKAKDLVSFDSKASLSYRFDGKEETKKSSTETIDVKKSYNITHTISKEAADQDEIVEYNLTIINNDENNPLDINLEINLPAKIITVNFPGELKKQGNKLVFTGTIEKDTSKTFRIEIKSSQSGKYDINTLASAEMFGLLFKDELKQPFNVGLSYVLPILEMPNEAKSNSDYTVYLGVKNYGEKPIEDITVKVESNLFIPITKKIDLEAGATSEIFRKTLTSPYLAEDRKFNVKISGYYTSSSGKMQTFEKTTQLNVKAQPQIIEIIKEFNKEGFYRGDEIKVMVKLKNQRNQAINAIDISDIFPQEIRSSLIGNVIGYLEKLDPNEEKKVYSYSLVIPKDYAEEEIEFKTIINTEFNEELTILKRTDNVKILTGKKPEGDEETTDEETVEQTNETEGAKNEPGSQETEKDKNVTENLFKRIINWVKNLFRK